MGLRFPTEERCEGAARVLVPVLAEVGPGFRDQARSRAAVFYNPLMRLNRDTAVLVLGCLGEELGRSTQACEPMCGSGVRGVRLALESGAGEVVLGDLNPSAVELAEENISRNGVGTRVHARVMDANLLMNLHSSPLNRFDYVDVDPYGSPSQFLDSAVRATRDGGVLALTATDLAPLCGVSPAACLRKYGGKPLRCSYSHEVALRLLIGSAVRVAAVHECAVKPVFSYYADHYIRAYLRHAYGAKPADTAVNEMGYILHCEKCLHRTAVKGPYPRTGRSCPVCGTDMKVAGPMWLGELADPGWCTLILERATKSEAGWEPRLLKLVETVRAECGYPPTYLFLDEFTSRLKISSSHFGGVLDKLHEAGYSAVQTHFNDRGIKTNASVTQFENVLKA
jgi:tRNA (guanine26-N2/guanine27-N2)-dimethyltransferase